MSANEAIRLAGHSLLEAFNYAGSIFDDSATARTHQSHVNRRLPRSDVNLINETGPVVLEPLRKQFEAFERLVRSDNSAPAHEELWSVVQIIKDRLKASGVIRDGADDGLTRCGFPKIERSLVERLEILLRTPREPVLVVIASRSAQSRATRIVVNRDGTEPTVTLEDGSKYVVSREGAAVVDILTRVPQAWVTYVDMAKDPALKNQTPTKIGRDIIDKLPVAIRERIVRKPGKGCTWNN